MPEYVPSISIAIAPYNFISLPTKVEIVDEPPSADRYHTDNLHFSGYFDCTLETLTPLYIRSSLTDTEYQENVELQKKNEYKADKHNPEFFNPAGYGIKIPGSSLRGMIRFLVEIVSKSALEFVSNPKLFYRAVGDTSSLGQTYREDLVTVAGKVRRNGQDRDIYKTIVKAGYLYKDGNHYKIRPAQVLNKVQYFRIEEDDALSLRIPGLKVMRVYNHNKHRNELNLDYKALRHNVWFSPKQGSEYQPNHSVPLDYAKLTKTDVTITPPKSSGWYKGCFVASGWIPGQTKGKHLHWIVCPPEDSADKDILLELEDVLAYQQDVEKLTDNTTSISVIPANEGFAHSIACFFIDKTSFGYTAMLRRPYRNTPNAVIPVSQKPQTNKLDLTQAIFGVEAGRNNGKAGRVFFEDAVIDHSKTPAKKIEWTSSQYPHILSNPKITTFQHYLQQDYDLAVKTHEDISKIDNFKQARRTDSNQRGKKLNFWDSNPMPQIRGYKLYWHRQATNWIQTDENKVRDAEKQYTRICPVNQNVFFKFRIRFENLTAVELGALAMTLDLPTDCAHKLGMGKALGLGSVRLTPTLVLLSREQRYSRLFDTDTNPSQWFDGRDNKPKTIAFFKNAFAAKFYGKNEAEQAWLDDSRLGSLKIMLNEKNKPTNNLTGYMRIESPNDFISRPTLMPPEYYVDQPYTNPATTPPINPNPPAPNEPQPPLEENTAPPVTQMSRQDTTDWLKQRVQKWATLDVAAIGGKGPLKTEFSKFIKEWLTLNDNNPLKVDLAEQMWQQIYANDLEQEKTWKFYSEVQQIQQLLKQNKRFKK